MEILKQVFKILLISFLLFTVLIIFRHPHKSFYTSMDDYVFSTGNASESVRAEILEQLHKFQDGYTRRDIDQVDPFMEQLFSQENALVLGTMPDEIYIGYDDISDLIFSDWNAWGDVTFIMDTAHISTSGNVAWIATIGFVEFDLSRFLVLPLRLSAVMVKEGFTWKFQFIQYQFDLFLFTLFITIPVLMIWLLGCIVNFIAIIVKRYRKST